MEDAFYHLHGAARRTAAVWNQCCKLRQVELSLIELSLVELNGGELSQC